MSDEERWTKDRIVTIQAVVHENPGRVTTALREYRLLVGSSGMTTLARLAAKDPVGFTRETLQGIAGNIAMGEFLAGKDCYPDDALIDRICHDIRESMQTVIKHDPTERGRIH